MMETPLTTLVFPLNVYAEALRLEYGAVDSLHLGLMESGDASLARAQARATERLLALLPPPPCRVLEVGIGLGKTFERLSRSGYEVTGVTPDHQQIKAVQNRAGGAGRLICTRFEDMEAASPSFDVVLFQESAQYIQPAERLLLDSARHLAPHGTVAGMDEFPLTKLKRLREILPDTGLVAEELTDLTRQACDSCAHLIELIDRHGPRLARELARATLLDGLLIAFREFDQLSPADRAAVSDEELAAFCAIIGYLTAARGKSSGGATLAAELLERERAHWLADERLARMIIAGVAATWRARYRHYLEGSWRYVLFKLRKTG
ncbi:MAG TPA: methyltransferase domain-containing protein [Gammaproteobacteria bacterium]|nr:methyltransferase domain-containing protein [Gammaproteobacteria bacterium]